MFFNDMILRESVSNIPNKYDGDNGIHIFIQESLEDQIMLTEAVRDAEVAVLSSCITESYEPVTEGAIKNAFVTIGKFIKGMIKRVRDFFSNLFSRNRKKKKETDNKIDEAINNIKNEKEEETVTIKKELKDKVTIKGYKYRGNINEIIRHIDDACLKLSLNRTINGYVYKCRKSIDKIKSGHEDSIRKPDISRTTYDAMSYKEDIFDNFESLSSEGILISIYTNVLRYVVYKHDQTDYGLYTNRHDTVVGNLKNHIPIDKIIIDSYRGTEVSDVTYTRDEILKGLESIKTSKAFSEQELKKVLDTSIKNLNELQSLVDEAEKILTPMYEESTDNERKEAINGMLKVLKNVTSLTSQLINSNTIAINTLISITNDITSQLMRASEQL